MKTGIEILAAIDAGGIPMDGLPARLRELDGAPCLPSPRTRYNLACDLSTMANRQTRAIELLGDDSRRDPHPWALEDPSLQDLRRGPRSADLRSALRRGNVATLAYPLGRLDAIGPLRAEVLSRAAIRSPSELVVAAGTKDQRDRFAKTTGVDGAQLTLWAKLAELALLIEMAEGPSSDGPVTAVALDLANLLWLSGIDGAAALLAATTTAPAATATPTAATPGTAKDGRRSHDRKRQRRQDCEESAAAAVQRGTSPATAAPPSPVLDSGRIGLLAERLSVTNTRERVVVLVKGRQAFAVTKARVRAWSEAAIDYPTRVDAATAEPPADGDKDSDKKGGDQGS